MIENYMFIILDILPPQPQELEAMNITDKSFILKWSTVTGEGSSDERTLYQVWLITFSNNKSGHKFVPSSY